MWFDLQVQDTASTAEETDIVCLCGCLPTFCSQRRTQSHATVIASVADVTPTCQDSDSRVLSSQKSGGLEKQISGHSRSAAVLFNDPSSFFFNMQTCPLVATPSTLDSLHMRGISSDGMPTERSSSGTLKTNIEGSMRSVICHMTDCDALSVVNATDDSRASHQGFPGQTLQTSSPDATAGPMKATNDTTPQTLLSQQHACKICASAKPLEQADKAISGSFVKAEEMQESTYFLPTPRGRGELCAVASSLHVFKSGVRSEWLNALESVPEKYPMFYDWRTL
jgi:hypothetical protein